MDHNPAQWGARSGYQQGYGSPGHRQRTGQHARRTAGRAERAPEKALRSGSGRSWWCRQPPAVADGGLPPGGGGGRSTTPTPERAGARHRQQAVCASHAVGRPRTLRPHRVWLRTGVSGQGAAQRRAAILIDSGDVREEVGIVISLPTRLILHHQTTWKRGRRRRGDPGPIFPGPVGCLACRGPVSWRRVDRPVRGAVPRS